MPSRPAKFVSAIFAGVLASIPLSTISHGATPVADDCLSGPKDHAPQGSHWYYRIDHATKRHCWYLKDQKPSQSAAATPAPATKPVSSDTEATQRSIADAHAEWPAQTTIEQPKHSDGLTPAIAADAPVATPPAQAQGSLVAARWPEQSETVATSAPAATTADAAAATSPNSDATPSPAPAAPTLAAAEPAPERTSGSLQMLLLGILGALVLAGLIGSAVFRFGNLRWIGRSKIQVDRRAIWDEANIDRRFSPVDRDPGARIRRNEMPWELRAAEDQNGRIEAMLARLARSAAH